jgi:hypothetical protein
MSRKRKRRNRRPGNIKNDPLYDPFPKAGLVRQYELYIRKVVRQFAKAYPHILLQDLLFRAVELASAAEKTFKQSSDSALQPISADLSAGAG